MLRMLDCFCGLGGASEGFHVEGFECVGIDIVNVGYPYDFIHGDMNELRGEDFKNFDVVWGSPPCRDFSQMAHVGFGSKRTDTKTKWAWKIPPSPENGLKLVNHYIQFVAAAKPKIWIMENVPNLANYIEITPRQITRITQTKKRAFWGNYPSFFMPMSLGELNVSKCVEGRVYCIQGKYRSWKRAKIPLACSQAFARACKEALT